MVDIPKGPPKALILLCHGLTGDRSGPQRILTTWAKVLEEHQYLVVRFDFRGSGDSSDAFEKTTITSMKEDIQAVISWCYAQYSFPHLILAGLSLGGIAALKTITDGQKCLSLCLFSSDLNDTPSFILEGDPVPIREGQFFLEKAFFDERLTFLPKQQLLAAPVHILLFYGQDDKKISQIARELENRITTVEIKNTGHLFESLSARLVTVKRMIDELDQLIGKQV